MKYLYAIMAIIALCFSSCGQNGKREAQLAIDANNFLKGDFKGYATVYVIDFINNSYERDGGGVNEYKVYEDDGDYKIDYRGETYILQEVDSPIEIANGYTKLKWKLDYNHYIEDIPHSY